MSNNPLLTIVVHVYNIEAYLPRCLDCVLAQTFTDWKMILIDDESSDNTFNICQEYEKRDNRIKAVKSSHKGLAQQRNVMMDYVDTEFYVSLDGDDYITSDYLKHLVDAQRKYNADLVISRVAYVPEDRSRVDGVFPERGEQYIAKEEITSSIPQMLADRRLNFLYAKLYRACHFKEIKVDDDVKTGSDTMINIQYVARANSIVLIDDIDYQYVKYNTRSVTSYSGNDMHIRVNRINNFVADFASQNGLLTTELRNVIDERILLSVHWFIEKLLQSTDNDAQIAAIITEMLSDPTYRDALKRQHHRAREINFELITDKDGEHYMKRLRRSQRVNYIKSNILSHTPGFITNAYHRVKYGKSND